MGKVMGKVMGGFLLGVSSCRGELVVLLSAPVSPHPLPLCPCQAGAFKIGDTAGTLDNIIACKLYRPGSVGFVSKSGGMSNEMYNVLSRATDGLYEGEGVLGLEVVQGFVC